MFSKTLQFEWIVVLLASLGGSYANNLSSISPPSSGSVTKSSSTKPTSSELTKSESVTSGSSSIQQPPITSCAPVNFFSYFAPSLQALPPTDFVKVAQSKLTKYYVDFESLARYIATPPSDASASREFVISEASFIHDDVQSIFGTYGYGPLHFSSLYTDACLFSGCLNSFSTASLLFTKYEEPALLTSSWYFPGYYDIFYVPAPPCCGGCSILADEVEVKYWPTPAPISAAPTLIDVNQDITYVSPSVYVSLRNLRASNACGQIGNSYSTYINAYLPGELSSSAVPQSFDVAPLIGNWTKINFADFDSPKCKCTANCKSDPVLHTILTNLCTPQLSLPPGISLLDPLWATCTTNSFGVFDPPFALTLQPGLTAPKVTPATPTPPSTPPPPVQAPSETAPGPGSTPTPPVVSPTTLIPPPAPQTTPVVPPIIQPSSVAPPIVQPSSAVPPAIQPSSVVPPISQASSVVPPVSQPTPVAPPAGITSIVPPGVIVNSQTIPINSQGTFTVGSQTLTVNSQGDIIIGTSTISAGGPAITLSGSTISVAPGGTPVVFDGTTTTSLGSIIASIFSSSTSAPAQYTGSATRDSVAPISTVLCLFFWLSTMVMWL